MLKIEWVIFSGTYQNGKIGSLYWDRGSIGLYFLILMLVSMANRFVCLNTVRMLRKNGQFASVKDVCKTSDDNCDSGNNTPQPEPV